MESKAIEFIKSEGLMEDFEKFKEVPEVKFIILEGESSWAYQIDACVNDEYIVRMSLQKRSQYSIKIHEFNYMIERVYQTLGVRASRAEMLDETTEKYGFDIKDVVNGIGINSTNKYLDAMMANHISNNVGITQIIYDAISVHREYLREAFRLKEKDV